MSQSTEHGAALITGASTGIGATYADRLARRGYDLILVARDAARLEALAARLRQETGVAVHVLPADLTAKPDLARVEDRLRHDESITLLVNNAGVAGGGPFAQADLDRVESMIQLNVLALTRLAGAALPGFVARGRGIIVNLASVVALAPERFPRRLQRHQGLRPVLHRIAACGGRVGGRPGAGRAARCDADGDMGAVGDRCVGLPGLDDNGRGRVGRRGPGGSGPRRTGHAAVPGGRSGLGGVHCRAAASWPESVAGSRSFALQDRLTARPRRYGRGAQDRAPRQARH